MFKIFHKNCCGLDVHKTWIYACIGITDANAVVKSDKHPECKNRYRRLKARRGHKKAIIAVCRMLLTAIWNILAKLEPYSTDGYLEYRHVPDSKVITKSQGLHLLRMKGFVIKDDPMPLVSG